MVTNTIIYKKIILQSRNSRKEQFLRKTFVDSSYWIKKEPPNIILKSQIND